jgi:hypothetical protein
VHRIKLLSDEFQIKNSEKKNKKEVVLRPKTPGYYEIQAKFPSISNWDADETTKHIQFWYPIEKVHLHYPPIVEVNTSYEVHAALDIKSGSETLLGTETLLGSVKYKWTAENVNKVIDKPIIEMTHTDIETTNISVTADNEVTEKTAHGEVQVKGGSHFNCCSRGLNVLLKVSKCCFFCLFVFFLQL